MNSFHSRFQNVDELDIIYRCMNEVFNKHPEAYVCI